MRTNKEQAAEKINEVAEINGVLTDALVELGMINFVTRAGTEYGRPLPGGTVLGYVEIGREQQNEQDDEEFLFTIAHIVGNDWVVFRNVPGLHDEILGQFENAYGAVGAVRQNHPVPDLLTGATPTYPEEEVVPEFKNILKQYELVEYITDVDLTSQEVVFSSDNCRPKIHLRINNDGKFSAFLIHQYGFDMLGTWESVDAAVERVEAELQRGGI